MSERAEGMAATESYVVDGQRPREYFDGFAEQYQQILDRNLAIVGATGAVFTRRRMEYLRRRLPVLPQRIMDFGCGIGMAIPFLLDAFPGSHVVGVDVSMESMSIARERNDHERFRVSTPADLAARDFDLVYASGVFHHIPQGERPGTLAFLYETLRPGGVVAISEHNPWNPATRYLVRTCPFDEDVHLLRPRETTGLLRSAGFELLSSDFVSFFPGFLAGLNRIEPFLRAIPVGAQYIVLARRG